MSEQINVLIVDDEKTNIQYVSKLLEDDYTIKVAFNGAQALKILGKIAIDLVLLDINMPIMDGYETIQKIKSDPKLKDIPVIFLTASKDDATLIKVFRLGASDYISKPFNKEELKIRVSNHLSNYFLQKDVQTKIKQINSILNEQDNIVILSDKVSIEFANKQFFQFLGYKDLESFNLEYQCICEKFIQENGFFHMGDVPDGEYWAEVIMQLPRAKRIVKLYSYDMSVHVFSVNITRYEKNQYIINFADISDTILNQIELEKKVQHDKLTGAFNREYFEKNYKGFLERCSKENSYLAIAMFDLDRFKNVNDNYGHDVGDEVLMYFVDTINKYSRDEDILIRWGGEEFILILKVQSSLDLEKALEHLRKVIELAKFPVIGKQTCSIGGSLYRDNETIDKTIKRADDAVYKAKELGRNRIVVH